MGNGSEKERSSVIGGWPGVVGPPLCFSFVGQSQTFRGG